MTDLRNRLASLFTLLELYKTTEDAGVLERMLGELSLLEEERAARRADNYTLRRGSFGIAFLYLQLFTLTGNDAYLKKANSIVLEYYGSESFKCGFISDHSLFDGIAGILLVSMQLYLHTSDPWLLQCMEKLLLKLIKTFHEGRAGIYWGGVIDSGKKNIGLATGAAGVAIVMTVFGNVFDNKLLTELSRRALEYEEDAGLDGEAAKLYQGLDPIDEPLGLALEEAYRLSGDGSYRLPPDSIFTPGNPMMFEALIRKDFKHTFRTLNEHNPEDLNSFFRQKTDSHYDDFVRYVEAILSEEQSFPKRETLFSNFECERFGVSIRNTMQDCIPEDDETMLRIDGLLRLNEADFLSLVLVQSDKFRYYCIEEPLNEAEQFTRETFPKFMTQYGTRTFAYLVNDLDVFVGEPIGIYKLMFDQFASSTSIQEAHERIVSFLLRQNPEVLGMIRYQYHARYGQHIPLLVRELILDGIRWCMMVGLLVVSD